MDESIPVQLSRRERQIMDVVYTLGRATVAEVLERHGGGIEVRYEANLYLANLEPEAGLDVRHQGREA